MRKAPIHWTAASSAKCKAGSPPGNRVFCLGGCHVLVSSRGREVEFWSVVPAPSCRVKSAPLFGIKSCHEVIVGGSFCNLLSIVVHIPVALVRMVTVEIPHKNSRVLERGGQVRQPSHTQGFVHIGYHKVTNLYHIVELVRCNGSCVGDSRPDVSGTAADRRS